MAQYEIHIPDEKLKSLKEKLAVATFPDEIDSSNWDYGVPLADIKRLTKHWQESFDWRAQEQKLNELPNFHESIKVDGFEALDIHYVHQTSPSADGIPLLFVHGWPGSYIEVTKILPMLQQSTKGVSFHIVAPSLPNFGWSEGIKQKGFGIRQYAQTCHQLMQSLGYDKYVTQGGDWGFFITRAIGLLYPDSCLASHINMVRPNGPPTFLKHPLLALQNVLSSSTERDRKGLARSKWFLEQGSGYRMEQSTKPQTLGYGLADSPVGLLAWIYEKLHDWTDEYPWTDDEILTWISIYWFSASGAAASVRIYYEALNAPDGVTREMTQGWVPKVKLGMCHTPKELTVVPPLWGRTMGPTVYQSVKKRGGHFAAWEIPDEICLDLREMFGKGGPCYQIVPPKAK